MTIWSFCDSSWRRGEKLHGLCPELRVTFPKSLQQFWLLPDPVREACLVHGSSLCSQNGKRSCTPRSLCCKRSHLVQNQHMHKFAGTSTTAIHPPCLSFSEHAGTGGRLGKLKTKDKALLEWESSYMHLNMFNNMSCVSSGEVVWDPTEVISMQTEAW